MNLRDDYCTLALIINGREIGPAADRPGETVTDPATGADLARLPHATAAELDEALQASADAFPAWSRETALHRSTILRRTADLLRDRLERIARIMTLEQGKPLVESRAELAHAADLFEWYAEEGRRAYGRIIPARDAALRHYVVPEPVGPCAAFTPWNFPALTPARKLAGALAAGCPIILKASEETPGTAVELVRALADAGLPAGVAQLVFGVPDTVSRHLIASDVTRKISFTGSTAVGIHLMKLAADGVKRVTMELGGNAPVIIFDDADYDRTLATLTAGKLRNAGQVCVSPARFFVHESLADRFVRDLADRFAAARVTSGLAADVDMGPLANARRVEAMERFVEDAVLKGGRIAAGGKAFGTGGNFFAPTVVTDLRDEALLLRDECFGPIVPIVPFASDEEAYAKANAVPAGLAGYAFTTGIGRAQEASRSIRTGMVGINSLAISQPETPFGGVKQSGFGSEGGIEGLQAYQDIKLVTMA
jgi:succinate-semialdehyde dehydrogenase/glutarate-semialdehyde dehydrogenase